MLGKLRRFLSQPVFDDEKKLHLQAEQMSALYDIGLTITSNLDLDQILHDLFERCRRLLPMDTFYIAVYDESSQTIRHPLFYDGNQMTFVQVDDRGIETAPGLSGYVIKSKATLYLPNSDDPMVREKYKNITIGLLSKSYIGVPMVFHETVVGVISMQKFEPDAYLPEQILLLETIATRAAIAIANARLYREAIQAAERRAVLHRISQDIVRFGQDTEQIYFAIHEAASKLMPCDVFLIVLQDTAKDENISVYAVEENQRYTPQRIPGNAGFTGAVIRDGRSIILRNEAEIKQVKFMRFGSPRHVQSVVAVPMRIGDKVIGMTSAQCYQPYAYGDEEQILLEMLSTYAVIAIENARLYSDIHQELIERKRAEEKLRQRADQQEALRATLVDLSSELEMSRLLQIVLERAVRLSNTDIGELAIFDEKTSELVIVASYGMTKDYTGTRMAFGEGTMGHAIARREAFIVEDYQVWDGSSKQYHAELFHASLAMPLFFGERLLGAIALGYLDARKFTHEDMQLLNPYATQAAIAIENAHLYQAEQERRREADALRRAATTISSSLDADTVVKEVLAALKQVIPYDSGSVFFHEENQLRIALAQGYPYAENLKNRTFPDHDEFFQLAKITGKPIIVKDAQQDSRFKHWGDSFSVRGWMVVPLISRGQVIGAITFDSLQPEAFDENTGHTAMSFAYHAAAAIENAQLFEAEQLRRKEAETLREGLAIVAATLEKDDAIDRILEQLERVVPYNSSSVQLLRGDFLEIVGGRGLLDLSHIGMRFTIESSEPTYPILRRELSYLLYDDVQRDTTSFNKPPHDRIHAWLAVPLKVKGDVIGIITLDGYRVSQFSERHARLAVIFADQVAIALENARLYTEIQQELSERKRAEQSLRANEEKVRELNASLEKRVVERTQQLQAEKVRIEQVVNEVATLRRLSDFLQASMTVDEASKIIVDHMNSLFPKTTGGLYLLSDGFTDLALVATWDGFAAEKIIQPNDCWGMRRGRVFVRHPSDASPACAHFGVEPSLESMCLPLLAQNENIGMLCMQVSNHGEKYFTPDVQNLAVASADSIALALANLRLRERLHNQSVRDPLTGLFNRRYLEETLARETHRASRSQNPLCVIMFEVDDFKRYNNTFGHDAGDYVLRRVADTIRANLRRSDFPCRYGGDEFTLLLPETTLEDGAHRAEELRKSIEVLALSYNNQALGQVTVRMGVAAYPRHGETGDAVLKVADDASYQARAIGKNCVVVAE